SRQWRLLVDGKKASGTVIAYNRLMHENLNGEVTIEYASEIHFEVEGESHKAYGPMNLELKPGRTLNVRYDPEEPSNNCLLTFSGFYLNNYSVLPLILLILWGSFYLSFNSYNRSGNKPRRIHRFLKGLSCLLLLGGFQAGAIAGVTDIFPSYADSRINELLNAARPGDSLIFHAGTYHGPFILNQIHGAENRPVVLQGVDRDQSVIDGESQPGMSLEHYAFLLQNCSWINIENFRITNCWTDLIRAEDVSYLSVRNCNMKGGKRALFATGRGSHHFLMEHCTWEQDERVWTHTGDFSWEEIHHGIHRHYNGSLFQGSGISGVFVLRDNLVKNTFNAFRLSQMNEGEKDLLACTNGEIYRNTVINTSDNVLEPEVYTRNLHYYHNRMINGHAFISITEVAGGEIYIYGNTAVSLPDSEDGWTVFKISSRKDSLTMPLYIFNNSWQVDFDIIGSPRNVWKNNHIRHFNNASFSEKSDSFGIYFLGLDNRFDYDCSNVPFPRLLTGNGFESNGVVSDPMFRDPTNNDFRLKPQSPCIDRGMIAEGVIMEFEGERPDMGAYDNGQLVEGPPFRYMHPEPEVPFREMPRITRYKCDGKQLRVWFSMPLDGESVKGTHFRYLQGSNIREMRLVELSGDGYCLTLEATQLLEPEELELRMSQWPKGKNGRPVTFWASSIPVALF
ncbi:MAG: hypothetical protein ABFS38_05920, partial [Bacteroidota bacterium]